MPQHKGVEPFSRFWTTRYSIVYQTSGIPAGTKFYRPRVAIWGSKADADAFFDALKSRESTDVGHPAPGTIQTPFLENYFNKKAFIITFVNEHAEMVYVGS
jgi:hypothetical protein